MRDSADAAATDAPTTNQMICLSLHRLRRRRSCSSYRSIVDLHSIGFRCDAAAAAAAAWSRQLRIASLLSATAGMSLDLGNALWPLRKISGKRKIYTNGQWSNSNLQCKSIDHGIAYDDCLPLHIVAAINWAGIPMAIIFIIMRKLIDLFHFDLSIQFLLHWIAADLGGLFSAR